LRSDAVNEELASILKRTVCLVGVGNRMKGDDAFGPLLIDRLAGSIRFTCIDAGVAPENYLERIIRVGAGTVLFADAADFGGRPGELRIIEPRRLSGNALSTHALSLGLAAEYLSKRGAGRILLLAVQPAAAGLGDPVSTPVAATLESLAKWFVAMYGVDN